MRRKRKKDASSEQDSRRKTPTFLLELPLVLDAGQAKRVRAHLEVGRLFYNAVLSQGWLRLKRMRADPAWQGNSYCRGQQNFCLVDPLVKRLPKNVGKRQPFQGGDELAFLV